ncbi:acyl-CoA thioester hydrolase/BAAT C-terminal domain-containing protein [Bifidobacterium sp. ESL0790]|uniref:alpha/beta hydrolase family protein n=1 Tax=Bifidobacterium sp. ESL0790 TaxID=2983233 RepID=UPI0023F770D2|nr:acyl-CoA thioester hydrolase/BAAT C-terminal domain-containing protein [Bifidobacterium sp. ESL0790]WEV72052.1 alpha/beta hydrolase [Bifidobacterium sp. ESL0790]
MRLFKRLIPPTAIFVALLAVFATLGAAMTPDWQAEPLREHVSVASSQTTIQARDVSSPQEGTYQVSTTSMRIRLTDKVTINAVVRSPLGAPGKRPAVLFIHGAGTGKANEVYGDIASAMSSAGIVTLVPDKRLDTYGTFHRDYYAMARDYLVSLNTLRALPNVDASKAGIYAESEGTWVCEAMAGDDHAIPFMILTSPPAVSGRHQMAMAGNSYLAAVGAPPRLRHAVDSFVSLDFAPIGPNYADFPADRYLDRLSMPLLVNYGTDDLAMPIEQGAQDIATAAKGVGNSNVTVRYYQANHQMRVGAYTSKPGLPLEQHYTHDLEDWTNAVASGASASDWTTPKVAGTQPRQRFAVPTTIRPGLISTLPALLVLLVLVFLCPLVAGIWAIGIAIGNAWARHRTGESGTNRLGTDGDAYCAGYDDHNDVQHHNSERHHLRLPHKLAVALGANGFMSVAGVVSFAAYVVMAARDALSLTYQSTPLTVGWIVLRLIPLVDIALLTWLILSLWRTLRHRTSPDIASAAESTSGYVSSSTDQAWFSTSNSASRHEQGDGDPTFKPTGFPENSSMFRYEHRNYEHENHNRGEIVKPKDATFGFSRTAVIVLCALGSLLSLTLMAFFGLLTY